MARTTVALRWTSCADNVLSIQEAEHLRVSAPQGLLLGMCAALEAKKREVRMAGKCGGGIGCLVAAYIIALASLDHYCPVLIVSPLMPLHAPPRPSSCPLLAMRMQAAAPEEYLQRHSLLSTTRERLAPLSLQTSRFAGERDPAQTHADRSSNLLASAT